jgi:hypothetical protein
MSLYATRSLAVGIVYIMVFEGLLANFDFAVRRITIMYYWRILSDRWLKLGDPVDAWRLNPSTDPDTTTCLITLVTVSLTATILAMYTFMVREFRVKTPEGN